MIDHASISVLNYEESLNFYDQTLQALGYKRIMTIDIAEKNIKCAGYGVNQKPSFWISPMGNKDEIIGKAKGVHLAFSANSVVDVDAWYRECINLGGKDNGEPGPRPVYHPGYYGAFVIDPNGWRIEAAYHNYGA